MRTNDYAYLSSPDDAIGRRRFLKLAALCGAWGAASLLQGCSGQDEGSKWLESDPQTITLFLFNTVVNISAYCSEELMEQLVERCNYFEGKLSRTVEGSDVWNVNHAQGQPVQVQAETAELIERSLEFCERSEGRFDITIGAVSSLWDFVEGVKPDDSEIQAALPHIDYRNVSVEGTTVTLSDPEAMIDLGATAKGYIADDLARLLQEGGCKSAMVNLGGNVYVLGGKPDGSDWNVGVQDPNESGGAVVASIKVRDRSVVTSGLYERQFTASDGKSYYHILDPKTGYPAKTDLVSSSVSSSSSFEGDAYATWMFLLGCEDALALLDGQDGLEGLVVSEEGEVSQTAGSAFALVEE